MVTTMLANSHQNKGKIFRKTSFLSLNTTFSHKFLIICDFGLCFLILFFFNLKNCVTIVFFLLGSIWPFWETVD